MSATFPTKQESLEINVEVFENHLSINRNDVDNISRKTIFPTGCPMQVDLMDSSRVG
jgi:hypothetical protein